MPEIEIVYLRPPDGVERYRQELLLDRPELKITLQVRPPDAGSTEFADGFHLVPGSILLWYAFPASSREVGAFHNPTGTLLGYYGNIVAPHDYQRRTWHLKDLFLDVWMPVDGEARPLDREELEAAARMGWIGPEEAELARSECEAILAEASAGDWPPRAVRRWPLELVPALRLRRDEPGTYYAALVSGRLIAYGLYLFGIASVTSIGFAALTDAFVVAGAAQRAWIATIAAEGLALLPLTFGGRLPATRWPEPALTDERTLFIGTLAAGLAVLLMNDAAGWRPLLAGLYGALAVFLSIFGASRAYFDRRFPTFAVAGLAVSAVALLVLLL